MKKLLNTLTALSIVGLLTLSSLGKPVEAEASTLRNSVGWREAVEHPISALWTFTMSFNGNGTLSADVGSMHVEVENSGVWGCGDPDGYAETDSTEISFVLDKVYHCTVTGQNAYGVWTNFKRVPLHTILDRGGALDKQFNLYKLYINTTNGWEKLCPENMPYYTINEDNEDCHTLGLEFDLKLMRDFGARPLNRPGLKSLDGDEEPEVWTAESGGVAPGSAPGDEIPMRITAPRNGDTWSMTRNWAVSLGRLWSGGSADKIRLEGSNLGTGDFIRKAIVYSSPTYDTNEVQVLRSSTDTNEIVQIRAPQTLVVTTNTSSMSFEMRYYLTSVISGIDGNGFYTYPTNSVPFVTWRIDSPSSTTNSYRITEIRPWVTNITTLTYAASSNFWTLTRGTGADARIETRSVSINTTTNLGTITTNRLEIQEIKNGSGVVATKNAELYQSKPWPQFELTVVTNDPGGANLVTSFTFGEDPAQDGSYRQIVSQTWPDGYWELRDYFNTDPEATFDISGRLRHKINPWKDTSPSWDTNNWLSCLLTEYTWEDNTSPGSYTMTQYHYEDFDYWWWPTYTAGWRTYIEQLHYLEICQDTTQLWERHQYGNNWAYGEIIETLNYTLDAGPLAGQMSARKDWTAVMDAYDYIYGNYNPTNRTFTADTNGIDTVQIVYHGSSFTGDDGSDVLDQGESGYDIEPLAIRPYFSTKEVNYLNDGQLVLTRRYVYTGSLTNYSLIEEIVYQRDALGHTTNVFRVDPSTSQTRRLRCADWTGTNSFPGDLKLWDIDETGIKTTYTYDSLKRLSTSTKTGVSVAGYPNQGDILEATTYDASDRVLSSTRSGGGLSLSTSATFDKVGRVTSSTDQAGLTSHIGYQLGGQQMITTNSAGATKIALNYTDRRPKSVTGTAQVNEFYDYTITDESSPDRLNPKNVTIKVLASTNSTRWTKTATDQRHKAASEEMPQFHNTNIIHKEIELNYPREDGSYFVEFQGIIPNSMYPEISLRRYFWSLQDFFGQKILEGWQASDGNEGAGAEIASVARVHSFTNYFQTNALGHWFHVTDEYNYTVDNSAVSNLFSKTQIRLTGLSSNQVSEIISLDVHTNQSTKLATIDLVNRLFLETTTDPQSSLVSTQSTLNGLPQYETTATVGAPTWHYYDTLGHEIATRDPLGFVSGSRFDGLTGQLSATTNKNGQVTTYQYYPAGAACAGLLYCETGPTGKRTFHNYNSRGQETYLWGDVPYPEKREFNDLGDLVALSTYRAGTLWAGTNWPASPGATADVTTWAYDEPTGLLTNKTDAASKSVAYAYDALRQPLSKAWARGDSNTNSFEQYTGDPLEVDFYGAQNYSVTTTNYNRFGLPRLVIDNSGTHVLTYDYAGRVTEDRCTNGLMNGTSVKTRYDPVHGKDQIIVQSITGSITNSVTNTFGFDLYGRITGVTNGVFDARYVYIPNSDLLSSTTSHNSGSTVLTATRSWEFGYRLHSIENVVSGTSVSKHTYAHDSLGRRRRATLADGSSWDYGYDDRDEVIRARHVWSDFTPVAGQQFEFTYDSIGNRTLAKEGGDSNGLNLRSEGYSANNLNELTVRTNSSANEISGAAFSGATVTVNGSSPSRKSEYFDYALSGGNSTNAIWQAVTNVATLGGNSSTETGGLVLPPINQSFSYDADGNLTNDCVWTYVWDPENRLISMIMTNVSGIPNSKRYKLDYIYDGMGRRTSKIVSTWNGSAFGGPQTNRFVYDGWNLMLEIDGTNAPIRSYTWGLDLTGDLESAGGVGALIAITVNTNSGSVHFPLYDGNGNLTGLIKTDGTISAQYEFGPYGEPIRLTGFLANANPFRWSTKVTDDESGLVYFGRRYYQPQLGRWVNQDPIGLQGGLNLYAYIKNRSINSFDILGMDGFDDDAYEEWMLDKRIEIAGKASAFVAGEAYDHDLAAWSHQITVDGTHKIVEAAKEAGKEVAISVGISVGVGAASALVAKAFTRVAPMVVAAVGRSAKLEKVREKLVFVFGKAAGNAHTLERTAAMEKQMNSIGLFDNAASRKYMEEHLMAVSKLPGQLQSNGRVLRESLLMGPNGALKVQSIWEGDKLTTVILIGGRL